MVSRTILVPEERLGILVLTNAEAPAMDAIAIHVVDEFLGGPTPDLIAGCRANSASADAQADSVVQAAEAARDEHWQYDSFVARWRVLPASPLS